MTARRSGDNPMFYNLFHMSSHGTISKPFLKLMKAQNKAFPSPLDFSHKKHKSKIWSMMLYVGQKSA